MDYSTIDLMTTKELKDIAFNLKIKYSGSKIEMINLIRAGRDILYERHEQLGDSGKDATTFLVKVKNDDDTESKYAMKTFKVRKSPERILKEAEIQKKLSQHGICPVVIDVETTLKNKYIVMEKLDRHLIDVNGEKKIPLSFQKQLVKIYKTMDELGIFHGDANPLNYMIKKSKLYVIDFGMSKEINPVLIKKLKTDKPNLHIMTLGMILKLKNMQYPIESYKYLVTQLTDDQRRDFDL
jgi:tRNA A-37 threonylcarbamoyl transferase component Bud32